MAEKDKNKKEKTEDQVPPNLLNHHYDQMIESKLISLLIDGEYTVQKGNNKITEDDYQAYVDMLDSIRSEKEYKWMSDISIPEFTAHMLTQSALDAGQYFQTRDFVEVYLQDDSDEAKNAADAEKELINRTLNQRHLSHYQKFMRSRLISRLNGYVYLRCWWERKDKKIKVGTRAIESPGTDEATNQAMSEDVFETIPVIDRFCYDVIDPRNVVTNNQYTYNLQQKKWVWIRFEKTLDDLKREQEEFGYINLDLLSIERLPEETLTSKETYNKDDRFIQPSVDFNPTFDILERYGKFWCKVIERDPDTNDPILVEPGYDKTGKKLPDAELAECIVAFAVTGSSRTLIRFQIQPYHDAEGNPYRPLIRGILYIHPVKDGGTGDGQYCRELQMGIDDTFNISQDRVKLATIPTFKKKKYSTDDNVDVYIQPQHVIPLEDINDLQELKISSDINGALQQIGMLFGKMDQVTSVYPTTMGNVPVAASTTATAVAGAETKSTVRSNYGSLTYENSALCELYWMIAQMTHQFAHPETGRRLMGKKLQYFNPILEYFYKPLSQSIETEQSKSNKARMWNSILSTIVQVAANRPDAPKVINYILSQLYKYMGDEASNFANKFFSENIPFQRAGGSPAGGQAISPTSNQAGIEQSMQEEMTRGMANAQ